MTAGGRWRAAEGHRGTPERDQRELASGVSGTRPATRLSATGNGAELSSALVEASEGRVLDLLGSAPDPHLEVFATALPELFGAPSLARALELGHLERPTGGRLQDLVLVSPERVHVAHRLPRDSELAVLSVARRDASIGWIVSQARAALDRA